MYNFLVNFSPLLTECKMSNNFTDFNYIIVIVSTYVSHVMLMLAKSENNQNKNTNSALH